MKTLYESLAELNAKGLNLFQASELLAKAANTTPEKMQAQIITTWSKMRKDYEADREKTLEDFNEKWITNHPNFPAYKIRGLWESAFRTCANARKGAKMRVYADSTKKRVINGKLKKVTPHYISFSRCSAKVVFRVVLECGIRTDKPKTEEVVYVTKFSA